MTKDPAIRFTPMTELYKPVVELSKSILRHRPATGTKKGKKQVYGVLLDIAEVWEYYVYRIVRESLPQMEVVHTGRDLKSDRYLLRSQTSDARLGKLCPDICARRVGSTSYDYIIDAKYKAALCGEHYRDQPQREDLYQITSYLAALGRQDGTTTGVLAYPVRRDDSANDYGNPWIYSSTNIGEICLLGIPVELETQVDTELLRANLPHLGSTDRLRQ
jgi:5-methylcytosine-specific restriction enzyme subunit McrC